MWLNLCIFQFRLVIKSKKLRPVERRSYSDNHAFAGSVRLFQRNIGPKSSGKANTARQLDSSLRPSSLNRLLVWRKSEQTYRILLYIYHDSTAWVTPFPSFPTKPNNRFCRSRNPRLMQCFQPGVTKRLDPHCDSFICVTNCGILLSVNINCLSPTKYHKYIMLAVTAESVKGLCKVWEA